MDEKLRKQLEALTKKAKQTKEKVPSSVPRSSLHRIIKTKKQAERFMKLLESA